MRNSMLLLVAYAGAVSAICPTEGPSFDRVAGTPYTCSSSTTSDVHLYWTVDGASVHMALAVKDVSGWVSLSFPTTRGTMVPAEAVAGYGTTVTRHRVSAKSPAGVAADNTVLTDVSNTEISTLTIGGSSYRVLRFTRTIASIPSATLSVNYAYHSTSNTFPADRHTSRGGWKADLQLDTCTPSSHSDYKCQMAVDSKAMLHWIALSNGKMNVQLVVSQNTAGWAAVGLPSTGQQMIGSKALVSDGKVYDLNGKNPSLVVAATDMGSLESTSATVVSGDQVLRFSMSIASGAEVNLVASYHTTSTAFPVRHNARFGLRVQTGPASSPNTPTPTTTAPSTGCTASTRTGYQCQQVVDAKATLHWNPLANGTVDAILVVSQNSGGWSSVGLPSSGTSMVGAKALVSDGKVYDLNGRSAGAVVESSNNGAFGTTGTGATTSFRMAEVAQVSGEQLLRFSTDVGATGSLNLIVSYHGTSAAFPVNKHDERYGLVVATNGGAQVTTFDDNTEKAKTHGGVMVTVWAYVVPCAILLKRFGTGTLGKVGEYPIAFIMHAVMMLGSAITTTIFFAVALSEFDGNATHGHKDLGIALIVVIWVQVVLGMIAPPKDSSLRFVFKVSHTLLGVGSFGMAIGQMVTGLRNMEDLYTDTIRDNLLIAMLVGLCFFAVVFIVLSVLMVVLADPEAPEEETKAPEEGDMTAQSSDAAKPYE